MRGGMIRRPRDLRSGATTKGRTKMKTLNCSAAALAFASVLFAQTAGADDAKNIALLVGPTQDAFIGTWVSTLRRWRESKRHGGQRLFQPL